MGYAPNRFNDGYLYQMKHVVMYSGGIGSYCAAKRVIEKHGSSNVELLFADTKTEDADLYRFLREASNKLGVQLTTIAEGRDVWQVFFDNRFMGNSRVDLCSKILKREPCDKYIAKHYTPDTVRMYVGIDWSEINRFTRLKERKLPWIYEAPLSEAPYLSKKQMMEQCIADGIEPPRLYALGFSHNNCGGFCVKAGRAHFNNLLKVLPERYAYHEAQEQKFRNYIGRDVAILREQRNKATYPLTLTELRKRQLTDDEKHEWGGCGCFLDE